MSSLGRLGQSAFVYAVGAIVNAAIPFLLLPILTRYLGPSDYGLLAIFQTVIAVLSPLIGVGVPAALTRRYFEDRDYLRYFRSGLVVVAISSCVWLLAALIAAPFLAAAWSLAPVWICVLPLIAISSVLFQIVLAQFQIRQEAAKYGALVVSTTLVELLLAISLVVALEWGWEGRLLSQVITMTVVAAIMTVYFLRRLGRSGQATLSRADGLDAVAYGLPLVPHQLALWVIALSDRMFIEHYHTAAEVGLYTVAAQLASAVSIIVSAGSNAWTPHVFQLLKDGEGSVASRQVGYILAGLAVLCAAFGAVGSFAQTLLAGAEFEVGYEIFVALALAQFFYGAYRLLSPWLFFANVTRAIGFVTVCTAVINIALNIVMIPRWGIVGAGVATAISYFAAASATVVLRKRVSRTMIRS